MLRRFTVLAIVMLAACTGGTASISGSGINEAEALLLAEETREGCVRSNLAVMQGLIDRLAPLAEAPDLERLESLALRTGCAFERGLLEYSLFCSDIDVYGELVTMVATLELIGAAGLPVATPAEAEYLRIIVEAQGEGSLTEGVLTCRADPDQGVVIEGWLSTTFDDGCQVETTLDDVIGRIVADLPGIDSGVLFVGGAVDLDVYDVLGDAFASGRAALVGRAAVVALEIAGFFSHGEIDLG